MASISTIPMVIPLLIVVGGAMCYSEDKWREYENERLGIKKKPTGFCICGYDLTGHVPGRCPECGVTFGECS